MAIVINELLAFPQHASNAMEEDSIARLCKSTFNKEIFTPKQMLYEALEDSVGDAPSAGQQELSGGSVQSAGQQELSGGSVQSTGQQELSGGSVQSSGQQELSGGSMQSAGQQELSGGSVQSAGQLELQEANSLRSRGKRPKPKKKKKNKPFISPKTVKKIGKTLYDDLGKPWLQQVILGQVSTSTPATASDELPDAVVTMTPVAV